MKTLVLHVDACAMHPCSGWTFTVARGRRVSRCSDSRLSRQALYHSSFRAFCFHLSKVLLTGRYIEPPQPILHPKKYLHVQVCHNFSVVMWTKFICPLHKLVINLCTVEPRYNKILGTMKITLLYQVSHYIRVKKQKI